MELRSLGENDDEHDGDNDIGNDNCGGRRQSRRSRSVVRTSLSPARTGQRGRGEDSGRRHLQEDWGREEGVDKNTSAPTHEPRKGRDVHQRGQQNGG